MNVSGFSFFYPMIMSITIFGGSLEFVAVSMLPAPFAPLQTLIMTLMIQARHLLYGIAMLDKYKDTGRKKFCLIFGMCDETFSINCTAAIFGMPVVYCLKDVSVFDGSHGIPELIATCVVVGLHLRRRQMLLSIAGGTVCYMLMIHFVF